MYWYRWNFKRYPSVTSISLDSYTNVGPEAGFHAADFHPFLRLPFLESVRLHNIFQTFDLFPSPVPPFEMKV